ncbi:transferrin-binding protein-like solute binding protein [Aggregatibacter actinomycetemcomitans]|nr:transferrin-binding protein-like solute binding protein [Aggregatibacter actinomycetemcomitans]
MSKYEDKFFGPNAEEVAGKAIFDESVKDLNASFDAKKTK